MGALRPSHASSQVTSLSHWSLVTVTSESRNGAVGGGDGGHGGDGGDGGGNGGDEGDGGGVGAGGVSGLSEARQQPVQSQPSEIMASHVKDSFSAAHDSMRPHGRAQGSSPAAVGSWQSSTLRRTADPGAEGVE